MARREMTIVAPDGIALLTRFWSPAAPGAVACLLHGLGEHGGRHGHVAAALAEAGLAVVVPDLRGHGRSQGPRGHMPSWDTALDDVSLVLQAAEKAHPGLPVFLYGHSLGGTIVLNYLLRRQPPVAGAVVTSPLLLPAFPLPRLKLIVGRLAYLLMPGLLLGNEVDAGALTAEPDVVAAYGNDPLVHRRVSARLGVDMLEAGGWALAHAAELATPLLLMVGQADTLVSPAATAAFARAAGSRCTFRAWPALRHELHNEAPWRQVIAAAASWMHARLGRRQAAASAAARAMRDRVDAREAKLQFLDLKNISERYMALVNPSTPEKVLRIGEAAGLAPGRRVIDFGSGFGEALVLWAERFGISGVGIDIRQYACERARQRVAGRGLSDRVEIACGDAARYPFAPGAYDLAACIGATFIWGGWRPTLQAMRAAIVPGGKLAVGEPYWLTDQVPPEFARRYETVHSEIGLLRIAREEGLDLECVVRASHDDWDRYESDDWRGLLAWLDENPRHPERQQVIEHLRETQEEYLRYGRAYLGWAIYLLHPAA